MISNLSSVEKLYPTNFCCCWFSQETESKIALSKVTLKGDARAPICVLFASSQQQKTHPGRRNYFCQRPIDCAHSMLITMTTKTHTGGVNNLPLLCCSVFSNKDKQEATSKVWMPCRLISAGYCGMLHDFSFFLKGYTWESENAQHASTESAVRHSSTFVKLEQRSGDWLELF